MYDDQLRTLSEEKKILFISIMHNLIHKNHIIVDDESLLMQEIMAFMNCEFNLDKILLTNEEVKKSMTSIENEELYGLIELIRLATLSNEEFTDNEIQNIRSILEMTEKSDDDIEGFIQYLKEGDAL